MPVIMPRPTRSERPWTFLAEARRRLGLTQATLSEQVGVDQRTLSEWETGRKAPTHRHWGALSEALGVPCAVVAVEVANRWASDPQPTVA
jgi:transcriptional regulator with XRE-family HTH domain